MWKAIVYRVTYYSNKERCYSQSQVLLTKNGVTHKVRYYSQRKMLFIKIEVVYKE
jgi:hypothetical protein